MAACSRDALLREFGKLSPCVNKEPIVAWNRWYSIQSHVRSSLWVVPVMALVMQMGMKRLAERIDRWMTGKGWYDPHTGYLAVNAAEAHALLDRIFNLNLSCLVFAFGSLPVAIQVASGQYTPRIIATTLLRDNVIRWIVGLFTFTMLWAHRTMVQLGEGSTVPQLQVFLASALGISSLIAFIVLIDHCARSLRPVSVVKRIGDMGMEVIQSVYRSPASDVPEAGAKQCQPAPWPVAGGMHKSMLTRGQAAPERVIYHAGRSGIVLAVNLQALMAEASRAGCVLALAPQVGDFVGTDEPLFHVYGNADKLDQRRLFGLVAMGSERTMEQDPKFAFRIVVDIALKALSPAINDPASAVLAIDQLHRMLRMVGKRSLQEHELKDKFGRTSVILRTPNWEDFVHISFREIWHYSAGSLKVERRMRAMIENLIKTLPLQRQHELRIELELLDRITQRAHAFEQDVALAHVRETQGLGGTSR